MKLIYVFILIFAASVASMFYVSSGKDVLVVCSNTVAWLTFGFLIGYKVGIEKTSELMKQRIQQIAPKVNKNVHAQKIKDAFRRKNLGR